jgi:hypothetical protein
MEKELFLLIGTAFGALVAVITSLINNRSQLQLARENHEHQYSLEAQKLEYQQQKDHSERMRGMLEDTYRILLKITLDNSPTALDIARDTGMTLEQHHAQYLKKREDVHRLMMITNLYFPEIGGVVNEVAGLTNVFWGNEMSRLWQISEGQDDAAQALWGELFKISQEIAEKASQAMMMLISVAKSLS